MDHDIKEAIESIGYIRNTIEQSKTNYSVVSKLCIIFGVYHLSDSLLTLVCLYMPQYIDGVMLMKISILMLFSGSYLCIYGKEKRHMNKYYLSLINIWGFFGIAMPIMTRLAEILSYLLGREGGPGKMGESANVLLFATFLIVSAYVIGNKKIFYMAACMMFGYILLSDVWWDQGVRIALCMSPESVLSYSYLYYLVFVCGGYIFMGLYLRKRVCNEN